MCFVGEVVGLSFCFVSGYIDAFVVKSRLVGFVEMYVGSFDFFFFYLEVYLYSCVYIGNVIYRRIFVIVLIRIIGREDYLYIC